MAEKKFKYTKKCAHCGEEFQTNSPQKIYCDRQHYRPCPVCGKPVPVKNNAMLNTPPTCCSTECKMKLKHSHMPICKCAICGEEFQQNSGAQIICSRPHYKTCRICGKVFTKDWDSVVQYNETEVCSQKCRSIMNYGVAHPMQCKEVQEYHKAAMKAKYGVESPLQSPEIKQKAIESNRMKFGVDCVLSSPEIRRKCNQTMTEKYGAPYSLQSEIIKNKIVTTCVERYGVANIMQSTEIKQKVKATCMQKYGAPNAMQNLAIQEQVQAKRREHMPEILEKIKQTCLEKYGVPYYLALPGCGTKGTTLSKTNMQFAAKLVEANIDCKLEKVLGTRPFDIELVGRDIVLEIDPSYTHSPIGTHWCSKGIAADYHKIKSDLAKQYGYRCIHIFDWDDQDKIIQMLKPTRRLYARNLEIWVITPEEGNQFLNDYHLQGSCRGQTLYLGLVQDGILHQLMTFGKSRYDHKYNIELLRLCTRPGYQVVGGASRLLHYARHVYNLEKIISYCDLAKFNGDVYEAIGMRLLRTTPPQEIWSRGKKKITANLLRQRGYDQLFGTGYGKGTSNEELMLEHNWLPVYDCGQAVYVLD